MQTMRNLLIICTFFFTLPALGQRTYAGNSVLNQGEWYRLSVNVGGIYKVDGMRLKAWGININGLSSALIRLYGNGGAMLPEDNGIERFDDLIENKILVVDGGDGLFNENDYFLFYAEGPHRWFYDGDETTFQHQKNLYSDVSNYYLTIGGAGLRVSSAAQITAPASVTVTEFEDRYFYENDLFNLLKSGKEWLGEEFVLAPGKRNMYDFGVSFPNVVSGSTLRFRSSVAARSFGSSSNFNVQLGGQALLTQFVFPVGNDQYAQVANREESEGSATINQENFSFRYVFNPGSIGATGWLNWFEVFARRRLDMRGVTKIEFDYIPEDGSENIVEFTIQNADASVLLWDVTNPLSPVALQTVVAGTNIVARDKAGQRKKYIAFRAQNIAVTEEAYRVPNQNLHGFTDIDYIIVTHTTFLAEAQRLAQFHRDRNALQTAVVTTDQIYHEFASGNPDPVAIRDFVKMLYDRGITPGGRKLRYLLLFGDASYDYRNRTASNTNFVPCFESFESFNPLSTYTSDDFFGLLNDGDNINSGIFYDLDIGVGRIPAVTADDARHVVDKILRYYRPESYGQWRNEITLLADDLDRGRDGLVVYNHMNDAESHAGIIEARTGKIPAKIYLDAYNKRSGSGGGRYPEANVAVNNNVLAGTLIWNYSGHGGFRRLAEEVILENEMVNTWNNQDKLPLFVTATCDFAPFDNPLINSLGETLLIRPGKGAIALMTTTRVVFAASNKNINGIFFSQALTPNEKGVYPSLGETIRQTKNLSRDLLNDRKFTLLGDPALHLGLTSNQVKTTQINGRSFTNDTLSALNKYELKGVVTDKEGNKQTNFSGEIYVVIYDKARMVSTINRSPDNRDVPFKVQNNTIFRGKTNATNGDFAFSFIVPKDIAYNYGNGLISYYAQGENFIASANEKKVIVGGISNASFTDNAGPGIKAFLNDELFVDGGITNENPVLLIRLVDSSGINSSGAGIGHDITATINGDLNQYYILNDLYTTESGTYQKGFIRFQLPELPVGTHYIDIKVWDVYNNSSTYRINFKVAKDIELTLANLYNYPNPFTTRTRFMFEHNRPGDLLQTRINIYSISGILVKTIMQTINSSGNRSFEIEWDGTDNFGRKIGRGVYIYDLEVKDSSGKKRSARQKLVLL